MAYPRHNVTIILEIASLCMALICGCVLGWAMFGPETNYLVLTISGALFTAFLLITIALILDPDRIREVIGKGGSVIQKIVAESGAKIDIDDDGTIHIASPDAESCAIAKKCIDDIVFVPEVGKLYYGRVVRLMTFGAFVELAPGKDGLVHISKLADHRIEKVEDACKIGDMMWVKVTDIDEKGRVNLSHKDAMREIAAKEANGERVK